VQIGGTCPLSLLSVDGVHGLHMWRVAANVMNKQSHIETRDRAIYYEILRMSSGLDEN